MNSWRKGTKKQYNVYINKYFLFCTNHGLNDEINVRNTLQFLTHLYNNNLSYSAINIARSAISALSGEKEIGNNYHVRRLMKGIFNGRPSLPKYNTTWNPDLVLNFLKTWHPCKSLKFIQLSMKVSTLLLLLSGRRGQDIIDIDVRNIHICEDEIHITSAVLAKNTSPKFHPPPMVFKKFGNDNLCIWHYLSHYIEITKQFREAEGPHQLLLTTTSPHRPISRDTLGRWIKHIMKKSNVDTTKFSPHSTRSAVTSKLKKTISISTIIKSVGWKSDSVFNKYYNLNQEANEGLSRSLLQDL